MAPAAGAASVHLRRRALLSGSQTVLPVLAATREDSDDRAGHDGQALRGSPSTHHVGDGHREGEQLAHDEHEGCTHSADDRFYRVHLLILALVTAG